MEKIFNHKAHIEMWDWLSKNPTKNKFDWPKIKRGGEYYYHDVCCLCFACDYTQDNFGNPRCTKCPLIWGKYGRCVARINTLYNRHSTEKDLNKKTLLAIKIRDLKVRKNVKVMEVE